MTGLQRDARRVALYYPWQPGNAQDFLRGIARYARPDRPWEFCLTFGRELEGLLKWQPDGLIGHVLTSEAAAAVRRAAIPVVETAADFAGPDAARVGLDDRAIGDCAAEHLLDLGFVHFFFVGEAGRASDERRWEGFELRLRRAGRQASRAPAELAPGWSDLLHPPSEAARRSARELPLPAAVFAATDALALQMLDLAAVTGRRVPEELAILGVGNVELIGNLAYPPLSSVRVAADMAGCEAACLLDRLMDGDRRRETRIEFPPLGVVARRSTDVHAVRDRDLAAALRFIREHAGERMGVEEVARAACLSRSTLERRFRAALGRSPGEEILRVRLERARHLLLVTELPMTQVAGQAGFRDSQHLAEVFRARTGETPTAYRRRFRIE